MQHIIPNKWAPCTSDYTYQTLSILNKKCPILLKITNYNLFLSNHIDI